MRTPRAAEGSALSANVLPPWLRAANIFCALVPLEIADDEEKAKAYMDRARGLRPGTVTWEVVELDDLRRRQAVAHTLRGLRESSHPHQLVDRARGVVRVRASRGWQESVIRVFRMKGLASPEAPEPQPAS